MSSSAEFQDISPKMTVLEVLQWNRNTEAVFKALEAETGHCICCEALFDPLEQVASRYGLDLVKLKVRLEKASTNRGPSE